MAGETPNRWLAEKAAEDPGVEARSLSEGEAVGVWGAFGALMVGASSRIRAVTAQQELGWRPEHTDLLSTVGEERLRRLARPGGPLGTSRRLIPPPPGGQGRAVRSSERPASMRDHCGIGRPSVRMGCSGGASMVCGQPEGESSQSSWRPYTVRSIRA